MKDEKNKLIKKDAPEFETKVAKAEFKAGAEDGSFEGYFAVTGNVDDGGDIIEKGAFTKTIMENRDRVKVFYGHDFYKLVAPNPAELKEDEFGLYAKGKLILDSFWGKEVWSLLKANALDEGSVGFRSIKYDWDDTGIRHIHELKLFEVSFVPLGMNPMTQVRAMKMALSGNIADFADDENVEPIETLTKSLDAMTQFLRGSKVQVNDEAVKKFSTSLETLKRTAGEIESLLSAIKAGEPNEIHSSLLQQRVRAVGITLRGM